MTRYFHDKGLSANVLAYISDTRDWLLTEKVRGDDCTAAKYLEHPERLCDTLAERLAMLHAEDFAGCPVPNHTEQYLEKARRNRRAGVFDRDMPFSVGWNCEDADNALDLVESHGWRLRTDTLLHGDYCLPNIMLAEWRFSGFVDLDNAGVGDRHVDLFWATWTLRFNLKTDKYRDRFIDAYGRNKVDGDLLRLVAAAEAFE